MSDDNGFLGLDPADEPADGLPVLDDPDRLARLDAADVLRTMAGAGPRVRAAATAATEAGLAAESRPRAVLVLGAAAEAGAALRAVCGSALPVPWVEQAAVDVPAWVGVSDLVVTAVGGPDAQRDLAPAIADAGARGCELVVVGAPSGAIAAAVAAARATVVDVDDPDFWSVLGTLGTLAGGLGVAGSGPAQVEAMAARLEAAAVQGRPDSESVVNPAKALALELLGSTPVVVGTEPVGAYAARRIAGRIAAVAGIVAVAAAPDVAEALVNVGSATTVDDFFRDRVEDAGPAVAGARVLILGDTGGRDDLDRLVESAGVISRLGADVASADAGPAYGSGPADYADYAGSDRPGGSAEPAEPAEPIGPGGPGDGPDGGDGRLRAEPERDGLARLAAWCGTGDLAAAYLALAAGRSPRGERR